MLFCNSNGHIGADLMVDIRFNINIIIVFIRLVVVTL